MKKINTLISFCLLTIMSFAQTTKTTATANKYRLGFKVSPNVSWLASDNSNMTVGGKSLQFGYGLNFDIFFTEHYAIGTGFNINNTGSSFTYYKKFQNGVENINGTLVDGMTHIGEVNRDLTLKYFQVPLTFKMTTNEIGYITYWGQFGLGLNMNMKAISNDEIDFLSYQSYDPSGNLSSWENSSRESESLTKVDVKDDINIFSANLIFAAGIEYNLSGNTSLLAGFTFQNGFTDVLGSEGVQKEAGKERPLINADLSPATYKLSALPNYVELNIGILF